MAGASLFGSPTPFMSRVPGNVTCSDFPEGSSAVHLPPRFKVCAVAARADSASIVVMYVRMVGLSILLFVVHQFLFKLFQGLTFGFGAAGLEEEEPGAAYQGVYPECAVAAQPGVQEGEGVSQRA